MYVVMVIAIGRDHAQREDRVLDKGGEVILTGEGKLLARSSGMSKQFHNKEGMLMLFSVAM